MRKHGSLMAGTVAALLAGYAAVSTAATRPLGPAETWTVASAMIRAIPAHLAGRNPFCTFRLAATAAGRPQSSASIFLDATPYRVPLPPRTTAATQGTFITLATQEELREYLHGTLPRAGWTYLERLGSMHALRRDDLTLSIRSTFYAGTRIGELRLGLRRAR